jgi:transcriptional regulator with XRE-family HTH domain
VADKTAPPLREELLAGPGVRQAYERQAPGYAIARAIIAARAHAGLSQAELARRMATSQPFVARLESGRTLPSLRTLLRVAEATGTVPEFRLRPRRAPDLATLSRSRVAKRRPGSLMATAGRRAR